MMIEFKADVQKVPDGYIPIVNVYIHGTYIKSFDFADAPVFIDLFSAYRYAKKESAELNRRVHSEEK
jgi:hypothetical protein